MSVQRYSCAGFGDSTDFGIYTFPGANYHFSRDDIDESDYLYIYDREGKPIGDGAYSKYDYYNVYFFDSQKTTLYYFHNNI